MSIRLWSGFGRLVLAAITVGAAMAFDGPVDDAEALVKANRLKEAEAAYTRALVAKADDAAALLGRARVRETLGDQAGAAGDLDRAVRVAPKRSEVWQRRGLFRQQTLHDLDAALADLNQALALDPQSAVAYNTRGNVHHAQKNFAAALADYNESLRFRPEYAPTFANRAGTLISLGRLDEALEDAGRALKLAPDNLNALIRRAWLRDKKGDAAGALADYQAVLAIDPKNADAVNRLPVLQKAVAGTAASPAASGGASVLSAANRLVSVARELSSIVTPAANGTGTGAAATPTAGKSTSAFPASAPATTSQTPVSAMSVAASPMSSSSPASASTGGSSVQPAAAAPAAKSRAVVKSPLPPAPPKTGAAATSASTAAKRRPGYKFVSGEPGRDLSGSFTGQGLSAGLDNNWQNESTKERYSTHVGWTVPETIVPGMPAHFRLESRTSGGAGNSAYIMFNGSTWGSSASRMLVCVREEGGRRGSVSVPFDEFDLVLPDLTQGTLSTRLKTRLRSDEMKKLVPYEGASSDSVKTPGQLPVEEVETERKEWLTPESGWKQPGDIVIAVRSYAHDIMRYTYRWTEDCGPVVAAAVDGADHLELIASPATRKELRADGRDGLWLMARVMPKTGEPGPALQTATQGIAFGGAGEGAAWLDFGEPVMRDGWKMIYIQASNPDPVRGSSKPPASLAVQASAGSGGGGPLSRQLALTVPPESEIDAKPDLVDFTGKSGQTAEVKVRIDNPGPEPWKFRTEYVAKDRALATATVAPVDGANAVVALKEAGLELKTGDSNNEVSVLRILAEQKDRAPLERDIKVRVGQEGVFVLTTGRNEAENCYVVQADGKGTPTDVDFRVFLRDPDTQRLLNSKTAVAKLSVECLEPDGSVVMQALKAGQLQSAFAGIRSGNEPSGVFRFVFAREIPGDGRVLKADFRVSYPGRNEETFATIIALGIATTTNGPGSAEWRLELERCQEIIHKFVPLAYYAQMNALLDKRKQTLGAEGLRELRNRIWRAAVELTLGEGGQGYANEAAWADHITTTLEWTEWAGDMAFGAVIGTWTGPYGATGASMLKSAVISAINAYRDGRSADEWLSENLCTIPGLVEGKIVDPDTFAKWGVQSKAKAWAIFIGYHFCKNLYNGATLVEALKNTAKEAGGNVLSAWLSEKATQSAAKTAAAAKAGQTVEVQRPTPAATTKATPAAAKTEATRKTAPAETAEGGTRKTAADETGTAATKTAEEDTTATTRTAAASSAGDAIAVQRIRSRMSIQDGVPYANCEDVLAVMRDPSMVRALKSAPAEVQQAFSNTREALYRQHDAAVVDFVKQNVPDMQYRMVKVLEFRTPGQTGASLNTDRDYRVCYYAGRDAQTGKERWVEIDRRSWEEHSYTTFARITGGPADSPEAAKHWAEQHQQLATDKAHAEASPAFTDQARVWNASTRRFENTQVVSNIVRVKSGQAGVSLKDPQALGQMYQMKVADARYQHEAFVQAQKAVKELDAVMDGYLKQGRNVTTLPPAIVEGMSAVLRANKSLAADPNRRDPVALAEAQRTLRANGFSNLNDFMKKLGGQFESLKLVADPSR